MAGLLRLYLDREKAILGTASMVLFLCFWEGLTRGWWAQLLEPALGSGAARWRISPIFVSSPTAIAEAGIRQLPTWELWHNLGVSGLEFIVGFVLAIVAGIPLGLAAGWYRRFCFAIEPFLAAMNATPRVALLPLIMIWVGIGIWSKVLVVFLGAVIPICINTLAGVRTTDAKLLRVARSFKAAEARLFLTVIVPSAVPFILTGLRLGVGRAMVGVVVGELVAATAGIGFMITVAGASFQTDKVFLGVVIIAMAGLLMSAAIARLERRFENWRPKVGAAT